MTAHEKLQRMKAEDRILDKLVFSQGSMHKRTLERQLHANRTKLWADVFQKLVSEGWIATFGSGKSRDPQVVRLLRLPKWVEQLPRR